MNAETRRKNERRSAGPGLGEWTVIAGLVLLYADPRFDIAGFVLLGLAAAVHLLVTRGGPVAPVRVAEVAGD